MKSHLNYFHSSFIVTALGLVLGFGIGYEYSGTMIGGISAAFITFVLSMLEISLSFDNAVVNAKVLSQMSEIWRKRFMTWGILIAVFGMRIVFPLVVVSAVAWINPWEALVLALSRPDDYARIMTSSHAALGGFGASFLMLVSLHYFFDASKDVHWFTWIERPLTKAGKLFVADIVFCALLVFAVSRALHDEHEAQAFLIAAGIGIISFIALHAAIHFLHVPDGKDLARASFSLFMYLEVLDASFSLDGVIGAFAITNNLLIIAIGLGIGAMFVRSLTLMLVDKRTLNQFIYLEHGAFYAIAALAVIMLIDLFTSVPEVVTGLIGVAIIGLSLLSSVRHNRAEAS